MLEESTGSTGSPAMAIDVVPVTDADADVAVEGWAVSTKEAMMSPLMCEISGDWLPCGKGFRIHDATGDKVQYTRRQDRCK